MTSAQRITMTLPMVAAMASALLALAGWAWAAQATAANALVGAEKNEARIGEHSSRLRSCENRGAVIEAKLDDIIKRLDRMERSDHD